MPRGAHSGQLTKTSKSVGATGGVYKRQGHSQPALITQTYKTFLVHGEKFQSPIPTTSAVHTNGRAFRPGDAVQPTLQYACGPECLRASQTCQSNHVRPAQRRRSPQAGGGCLARERNKADSLHHELGAAMHHQLPNRKRTLNLLLRKASGSGKICVLSQIEPQTPRLVVSFRQYLQVSILQSYFPQNPKPCGFP
ncbi:Conserved_hypothetical protein [Hexamita inflata]|uniref:Uncharacterized protein n=1 Tax=Hexamita inflata TaxID=28002 RepID=A0AA86UQI4_9EUKA|nr:Conserved hypothetical protein [Hexamita inflata]